MNKEAGYANFPSRKDSKISKLRCIGQETLTALNPATGLAVVLTLVATVLIFSPFNTRSAEEGGPGSTVENFSLFRYEEDVTWKLSGEKAQEADQSLIVRDFELVIREKGADTNTYLYKFSGKEIRLKSDGKVQAAIIPGKVEIDIENELSGAAGSAKYDFSTGKVSGRELNLTDAGKGVTLEGTSFEYGYRGKMLVIAEGFRVTIDGSRDGRTEISGDRLTWNRGAEISTEGDLMASTESGWKLSATSMVLDTETDVLVCSGPVNAVKGDTRVKGEFLTYDRKDREINVRNARMAVGE